MCGAVWAGAGELVSVCMAVRGVGGVQCTGKARTSRQRVERLRTWVGMGHPQGVRVELRRVAQSRVGLVEQSKVKTVQCSNVQWSVVVAQGKTEQSRVQCSAMQ